MSTLGESRPRRHRITVDEYYRMAEVGLLAADARVELIDGEIIDMAPIGAGHAAVVDQLARMLIEAVGDRAIVRVQGPIRLSDRSEPEPDLAVLAPRADFYGSAHPTGQDTLLVIEVGDTSLGYDRDVKARLYARHGVPELWILDLPSARLHLLQAPRDGEYSAVESREKFGVVTLTALPEIALELSGLALY